MKKSLLITSLAASFVLGGAAPSLFAAGAATTPTPSAGDKCLSDLQALNGKMQKDGYWLGGYGPGDPEFDGYAYGYGYPVDYVDGSSGYSAETGGGFVDARPGYEIRMLLTAADILAQHGRSQTCEDVVAAARDHYQGYVADMEAARMPMANVPGWQRQQIAAAQPVTSIAAAYRSDQLLDIDVRNQKNQALGRVDDLVTSPQTGKIAYLVIARGGFLGIGKKYVAVPWDEFKIAPNATMLVLDVAKSTVDSAPQVATADLKNSAEQRQKIDAYWGAQSLGQAPN